MFVRDMRWRMVFFVECALRPALAVPGDHVAALVDARDHGVLALVLAGHVAGNVRYSQDGLFSLCAQFQNVPTTLTVTAVRGGFDWKRGVFKAGKPLPLQPVPLRQLCDELGQPLR